MIIISVKNVYIKIKINNVLSNSNVLILQMMKFQQFAIKLAGINVQNNINFMY